MISGSFFAIGYKQALLQNVAGHVFMMALYTDSANLDATTPAYTPVGEVSGPGYVAGGQVLNGAAVVIDGTAAILTFTAPAWPAAVFTARGAMIYDATAGNAMAGIYDFGMPINCNGQTFVVPLPPASADQGLLRIA